ncbi:hypothetical protein [Streptomyces scopuliridis]|uniref:hypothetical protein n=1 Tax=Streptomyces scopuliridis TaxID=452529 RepID=UPI0035E004D7
MAAPTDSTAQQLQMLGDLVKQQRIALGYTSKEQAAKAVGLSHVPYRNVENGVAVSDLTYAKVETGFGMIPGSCRAILNGADTIKLQDGGELAQDARSRRLPVEDIDATVRAIIQDAVGITTPDATMGQAKEISDRALAALRERGFLPDGH